LWFLRRLCGVHKFSRRALSAEGIKKMKKSKVFVVGMVALVFGLMFGGCAFLSNIISGVSEVETETSKSLMDGANDLILARDDGIVPATFKVAFERQFSGSKIDKSMSAMGPNYQGAYVDISYQDKNYRLTFTGNGPSGQPWSHITSATQCVELQKKES
jgi:hypothetical protein